MRFRNVIWIRHGKTGGTSLEYALAGINGHNGWPGCGLITVEPEPFKIIEVHSIRSSYLYGVDEFKAKWPDVWDDAYKFTLVRNPYDRFVSAWKYLDYTSSRPINKLLTGRFPEVVDFHLKRPQTKDILINGRLDVDHIVRFEDFQNSVDGLCDILEIDRRPLPHLRKSDRLPPRHYFNAVSAEMVYDHFKDDFEYLGYTKDSWK